MPASPVNWILLAVSFLCVIPACALCWRAFDKTSYLFGDLHRQANYEVCGFLFFFLTCLLAVAYLHQGKNIYVIRSLSIGILVYVTIYGLYTNFTNLNNLRISEQSNSKGYFFPYGQRVPGANGVPGAAGNGGPIEVENKRRYFAGLILGYVSLLFGLLSTITNARITNAKSGAANTFWFLGLLLCIPGVIVCWTNNGSATYPTTNVGNAQGVSGVDYAAQNFVFLMTTFAIVQFLVLTLGLLTAADDLLGSSAFIYGIGLLFAPVYYFYIQSLDPNDSDFLWAGPILLWIGGFFWALSSILAQSTQKEAQV